MANQPKVAAFWDEPTGSWQYVFHDPETMKGAIVDPVWNFDPLSGATGTEDAQNCWITCAIPGSTWNGCWTLTRMPTTFPPVPG